MAKIKVMVTGANGFVGSHFVDKATDFELLTPRSEELDLRDAAKVKEYLEEKKPDWVVNFAAYTDVNKAEEQKGDKSGDAWTINVEAVKNLLEAFNSKNFIQISTDMVFPGNVNNPGPYRESDKPSEDENELTWYGWTKNRGERLVRERGGVVVRIIYPVAVAGTKMDYIRSVLKRYAEGKMYPLFDDQQVSVTYIPELILALKKIISEDLHGIYHVSSDTTTPYELLRYVIDQLDGDAESVKNSSVVEFLKTQENKNRYPIYGGLNTKITEEKLEMKLLSWQGVVEYLIAQGLQFPKVGV